MNRPRILVDKCQLNPLSRHTRPFTRCSRDAPCPVTQNGHVFACSEATTDRCGSDTQRLFKDYRGKTYCFSSHFTRRATHTHMSETKRRKLLSEEERDEEGEEDTSACVFNESARLLALPDEMLDEIIRLDIIFVSSLVCKKLRRVALRWPPMVKVRPRSGYDPVKQLGIYARDARPYALHLLITEDEDLRILDKLLSDQGWTPLFPRFAGARKLHIATSHHHKLTEEVLLRAVSSLVNVDAVECIDIQVPNAWPVVNLIHPGACKLRKLGTPNRSSIKILSHPIIKVPTTLDIRSLCDAGDFLVAKDSFNPLLVNLKAPLALSCEGENLRGSKKARELFVGWYPRIRGIAVPHTGLPALDENTACPVERAFIRDDPSTVSAVPRWLLKEVPATGLSPRWVEHVLSCSAKVDIPKHAKIDPRFVLAFANTDIPTRCDASIYGKRFVKAIHLALRTHIPPTPGFISLTHWTDARLGFVLQACDVRFITDVYKEALADPFIQRAAAEHILGELRYLAQFLLPVPPPVVLVARLLPLGIIPPADMGKIERACRREVTVDQVGLDRSGPVQWLRASDTYYKTKLL